MTLLPRVVAFDWDDGNSGKNLAAHGVSNQEAEEAFFGPRNVLLEDERHSNGEFRYALFGETARRRKLAVIFTLRRGRIRVISARDMSRRERRVYEERKENPEV